MARIDCFVDLTLSHQNVQPPQTREDEETFLIFEQTVTHPSFREFNLIILENQTLPQYKLSKWMLSNTRLSNYGMHTRHREQR